MIVSEKSHQNLLFIYPVSIFKKELNLVKQEIISSEKIRYSGNYIYLWLCSLVLRKGFLIQAAILVIYIYIEANRGLPGFIISERFKKDTE